MQTDHVAVPRHTLAGGTAGVDVWTARWDGPDDGPVFVCVHGLGGSHVNWSLVAPVLAGRGTVHAPDLAGFGLTLPTGRQATVRDNVDLLAGFIRTVSPQRPVVLLGNSMGGLIAILLAAWHPELVAAMVLIAPATPRPLTAIPDRTVITNFALMATPFAGEQVLALRQRRTTPEQQVRETMQLCVADPSTLDADVLAAHIDIATRRRTMPHARSAMLQAARSLLLLTGPRARVLWQAVAAVQAPTMLLHGAKDRLVSRRGMTALARRRRDWTFVRYDDCGHIPMLEAPARVADDISIWLDRTEVQEPAAR